MLSLSGGILFELREAERRQRRNQGFECITRLFGLRLPLYYGMLPSCYCLVHKKFVTCKMEVLGSSA